MAEVWVNKAFVVQGETIEIDHDTYLNLNLLAAKFYSVLGYETKGYHDFYESPHPQEQSMFVMALEAYAHHLLIGLD
jgi:hypothetical protein